MWFRKKSIEIRRNIEKDKRQYIHFPFGGEFNRKDVINKLKKIYNYLQVKKINKKVIHLDLYDSKPIDLMKNFLYSFWITKLYRENDTLVYISKDIKIKIEIPNGFIDFFLKFPI